MYTPFESCQSCLIWRGFEYIHPGLELQEIDNCAGSTSSERAVLGVCWACIYLSFPIRPIRSDTVQRSLSWAHPWELSIARIPSCLNM